MPPDIKFTLRQAGAEDLFDVRQCIHLAYAPFSLLMGQQPAPMTADYTAAVALGHIWVCGAPKITGILLCYATPQGMHLETVAVTPAAQGNGLGRQLIQACERMAQDLGEPCVWLYTNAGMTGNLDLYRHLGYRQIDSRSDQGFDRVFFKKSL